MVACSCHACVATIERPQASLEVYSQIKRAPCQAPARAPPRSCQGVRSHRLHGPKLAGRRRAAGPGASQRLARPPACPPAAAAAHPSATAPRPRPPAGAVRPDQAQLRGWWTSTRISRSPSSLPCMRSMASRASSADENCTNPKPRLLRQWRAGGWVGAGGAAGAAGELGLMWGCVRRLMETGRQLP